MWWLLALPVLFLVAGAGRARGATRVSRVNPISETAARKLAEKWGHVFAVPPAYVVAIMKKESGLDAGVTSASDADIRKGGAWGLMQVTWDTVGDDLPVLQKLKDKTVTAALKRWKGLPSDLLDPDTNTMFGTYRLARLMKEFGNNRAAVFAAYNRGAGGTRKLIDKGVDLGSLDYVAKAESFYQEAA